MIYLHILLKGYEIHFCEWYVESILLVYGHALHVCIFIYTYSRACEQNEYFSTCSPGKHSLIFQSSSSASPPSTWNQPFPGQGPHCTLHSTCNTWLSWFQDNYFKYLSLHSQHLAKYLIYSNWSINAAFTAFWSATNKTRVLSCISSTENGITWLHTIARQLSRTWGTVGAVKQAGATANLRSKSQI